MRRGAWGIMVDKENLVQIEKQGYVVQSNSLIFSKQKLNKMESKLIRLAIMQIFRNDKEFKAYKIPITTFCRLLNVDLDLYCGKQAHKICTGIARKPLQIYRDKDWKIIPWVSMCEYQSKNSTENEGTIIIKLNDELKPYLLGLSEYYTQYAYESILSMQSTYAIRLFEMIYSKTFSEIPKEGSMIELSVSEIRTACDCDDKYTQIGMLKKRVVDRAVAEINENTIYELHYTDITEKKKTIGFRFFIRIKYYHLEGDPIALLEDKKNLLAEKKSGKRNSKRKTSKTEQTGTILDWEQQSLDLS